MIKIKDWEEFLNSVPTEELKKEIERRKSSSDIFTVISISGYEGPSYDRQPVHIIEDEYGNKQKAKLRSLCDEHLSELQPQLSDEEPGYDDAWEEYEKYQSEYLIGKKIKKTDFGYSIIEEN